MNSPPRAATARGREARLSFERQKMSVEIEELFTLQQLASFLKKKPASIYSDTRRRPDCLPPILRIPGSSKLLFVNPRQWAASFVVEKAESDTQPPRRRGAPTKAERVLGRGHK